jgi:hypothetical protein
MLVNAAAAVLGLALAAGQSAGAPPAPNSQAGDLPVSLNRIREELKKPDHPRLTAPSSRKADFKVEVNEKQHFQDLLDLLDFGNGSGPTLPSVWFGSTTPPLVSFNATGMGVSISKAIANARRGRAERLAREEVRRALDEFCQTHECGAK